MNHGIYWECTYQIRDGECTIARVRLVGEGCTRDHDDWESDKVTRSGGFVGVVWRPEEPHNFRSYAKCQ